MQFMLQPSFPNVFITDGAGRDLLWVRGAMTHRLGLWSVQSLAGEELAVVRQHGSPFLPSFGVYRSGRLLATVREAPGSRLGRFAAAVRTAVVGAPRRVRYRVDTMGGDALDVDGDATAIEYAFTRAGRPVATVCLRWPASAGPCAVAVDLADGDDPVLVLATTVAIETSWGRIRAA